MTDRPVPFSQRLDELEAHVRTASALVPRLGMVLGSGLGGLADEIDEAVEIPFEQMPGWPAPSVPGHSGRLILGNLRGLPVACLRGRLHMYEGLSERLVVEPSLLMGRLGAPILLLTNASGGVNPAFGAGTLMVMNDHINLTGRSPLMGPNDDGIGPRFAGSATGLVMSFIGLSNVLAPPVGNWLAKFGPGYSFLFWAGLAFLGGTAYLFLQQPAIRGAGSSQAGR